MLKRASTIQLKLIQGDVAPAARLLDRACRAAKPGLQLNILDGKTCVNECGEATECRIESPLLRLLLQQGQDAGGWGNVEVLSLMVRDQG